MRAAGDVHVNATLIQLIAGNQFAVDGLKLGDIHGHRNVEFGKGASQSGEVAVKITKLAVEHHRHLINRIGHEKAAIKDGDFRLIFGEIVAVHIDCSHLITPKAVWWQDAPSRHHSASHLPGRPAAKAGRLDRQIQHLGQPEQPGQWPMTC